MTSAQRQFLAKVDGIDGFFNNKTGGNLSADASKIFNGGEVDPEVLSSPAQAGDVTVGRGYKPLRDDPILKRLRAQVGKFRTTVSTTPTDEDLVPIGDPVVYSNALLIALNEPEYAADSGDAARYELVFAVGSVK